MHRSTNVSGNNGPVTKDVGKALLVLDWDRIAKRHGKGVFADGIGCTGETLENALKGKTMPEGHTLLNSLSVDATALDGWLDRYGLRLVPKDASCTTDGLAAPVICALLKKVIDAELDGVKTHQELLDMENELVDAEREIAAMRSRISDLRKPRAA